MDVTARQAQQNIRKLKAHNPAGRFAAHAGIASQRNPLCVPLSSPQLAQEAAEAKGGGAAPGDGAAA